MLKTVSSITNAIGALNFKGTWNATTNTPTIVSGVGVKGDYFVVSVAGSTTIDGISNWGIGDWIVYNGNVWQRVEGGADLNGVNLTVTNTTTLSGLTASTALALNASKEAVSVTNTGTGDNVLATSPTLVTPVLGTPSSGTVTNLTGTASININGTVGATTASTGSFTTLNTSGIATIDDKVRIGITSGNAKLNIKGDVDVDPLSIFDQDTAANNAYAQIVFRKVGLDVGSITSLTSGTSYNIVSDYRLKENVAAMSGALAKINQLKPCTYTWKAGGLPGQGFIAHELADVFPDAVTGKKDDIYADGLIKPQGIDTSFLVATLVAAIQELNAELQTVKQETATLKGV